MATTLTSWVRNGLSSYDYWNRLFWIVFIVLGIFIIVGTIGNIFFVDVMIGLVVVIIGMERLAEEVDKQAIRGEQTRIHQNLDYVSTWLGDSYAFAKSVRTHQDNRLHRFDVKRAEMQHTIEQNHRDLVRKILEVDNNHTRLSRKLDRLEQHNKDMARILLRMNRKTEKLTERVQKLKKK